MDLKNTLTEYVSKYSKFEQRSSGWHNARKKTIGGSEIASLIGENRFKSPEQLFIQKIACTLDPEEAALHVFKGNFATYWGTVFEEIISEHFIAEHKIDQIYGENIFIYDEDNPVSFSPDGLAIIDDEIVLLEFKCPSSNNSIRKPPVYYLPQVKYGLCKIEMAKYGLLCMAKYRRCTGKQVSSMAGSHAEDRPCKNINNKQYGIMGWTTNHKYGDIGSVPQTEFREKFALLYLSQKPVFHIGSFNEDGCPEDTDAELLQALNKKSDGKPISTYFYWKLVDYSESRINREPDFINMHLDAITEFTDDVNEYINNVDARDSVIAKYASYCEDDIEEIIEE